MSRRTTVLACLVTSSLLSLAMASPAAAASSVDYVALGDSYSAGVGSPGQVGSCLQSPNGYPGQWVAKNSPQSYTDLACSGATTDDVLSSQAPKLTSAADLISITIGGNDVGFADVVLTCKFGSDATCAAAVADAEDEAQDTLPGKLDTTFAAIKAKSPSAKVVVLDYPRLFDTASSSCGLGGMSLANRKVLNAGADVLDGVIQERTQAAGLTFADVRSTFSAHGICASSPYLTGFTLLPPTDSYHPNKNGYTYGYLPPFAAAAS
jgi:lysophospholipase L1-like esterase